MLKIKTNLRIVAMIIACLAITTMLATCGKTNDNGDDGVSSGKIDSRIIGEWGVTTGSTPTRYTYRFNADGTFFMVRAASTMTTAKFYTSNGVVYLQNVVTTYREDSTPLADKKSEYSFGTDQNGEYMLIAVFSTSEGIPDSNPVYRFRK